MNLNDSPRNEANEATWEIYEIAAAQPFAWSWRYGIAGKILRQGDIMYSDIRAAIEDALAHGMDDSTGRCEIVRADKSRIPYEEGQKLFAL